MTVTASKAHLLIIRPDAPDVEVSGLYLNQQWECVIPRGFIKKLNGASLIGPDCAVTRIVSYQVHGVAGVKEHFGSVFNFVFGLLFFSSMMRVTIKVEHMQPWDLPAVKKYVCDLIDKNPDAYTSEKPERIKRLVSTCKSVAAINTAILGSPMPNDTLS